MFELAELFADDWLKPDEDCPKPDEDCPKLDDCPKREDCPKPELAVPVVPPVVPRAPGDPNWLPPLCTSP